MGTGWSKSLSTASKKEDQPVPPQEVPRTTTTKLATKTGSRRSLEELSPIAIRELRDLRTYEGRFIACRAITSADLTFKPTFSAEDLYGDVTVVALIYITLIFEEAFPPGTIMLIKEPIKISVERLAMANKHQIDSFPLGIAVFSPSDIVLVDETDRARLERFGALKWYKPEQLTADELHDMGNLFFKEKNFRNALKVYDRALRTHGQSAVLQLNRSAALLGLEHFEEAYAAAESALHDGANKTKALFRLGQAAYGMREWQKAVEHFTQLRKICPSSRRANGELARAIARLGEARDGKYDMKRLYAEAIDGKLHIDAADYMGPVEIVEIPGKGKGIIASKDLPKGTLLIVGKALASATSTDHKGESPVLANDEGYVMVQVRIAQLLLRSPRRAADIYSLWAGKDIPREDEIPEGVIDMARIHHSCGLNGFRVLSVVPGKQEKVEGRLMVFGKPSFMNHSCVANAYYAFYGDMIVAHAIEDLKKGDEVTISYLADSQSLETREHILRSFSFRCECALCDTDRSSDPMYFERERLKAVCAALKDALSTNPRSSLAELEDLVDKIRRTYSLRTRFRQGMRGPLRQLLEAYHALEHFEKCADVAKEFLDCLEGFALYLHGPQMCVMLARVHGVLASKAWKAHDTNLGDEYRKEHVKYLKMARELTRILSGVDLDFAEYRRLKGYFPRIP